MIFSSVLRGMLSLTTNKIDVLRLFLTVVTCSVTIDALVLIIPVYKVGR